MARGGAFASGGDSRTAGGAGGGVAVVAGGRAPLGGGGRGPGLGVGVALVGLAVATAGLVWMTAQFWGRVRRSQVEDQLHARTIAWACTLGCISLVGLWLGLAVGTHALARAWVFTGLWGFVVVVYVTVAHRMIPFFTSSAMPMVQAWRPFWVLWLMLAAAGVQVLGVWAELVGGAGRPPG